MSTESVIWLAIAVVVVLLIAAALAALLRRRRRETGRERLARADELRHHAAGQSDDVARSAERAAEADQAARAARERAERADRAALEARQVAAAAEARQEDAIRRADALDPRVDQRADGYAPTTDPAALKDPLAGGDGGAHRA